MPITVFLSTTLRKRLPHYDPAEGLVYEAGRPMTVRELCERLNVPLERVKLVMVNGKGESLDYVLRGDERLSLFPPVGGG